MWSKAPKGRAWRAAELTCEDRDEPHAGMAYDPKMCIVLRENALLIISLYNVTLQASLVWLTYDVSSFLHINDYGVQGFQNFQALLWEYTHKPIQKQAKPTTKGRRYLIKLTGGKSDYLCARIAVSKINLPLLISLLSWSHNLRVLQQRNVENWSKFNLCMA